MKKYGDITNHEDILRGHSGEPSSICLLLKNVVAYLPRAAGAKSLAKPSQEL